MCWSEALIRKSRSGWAVTKDPSRGTNHLVAKFGDKLYLTEEEAQQIAKDEQAEIAESSLQPRR